MQSKICVQMRRLNNNIREITAGNIYKNFFIGFPLPQVYIYDIQPRSSLSGDG